ncbi:MAG: LysR family transcriptional regulator [Rhodocyclaceae bacterium]|nr:LysR family transcriptional regulator [Pseudomonadota bacterium]MDQ7971423.1 LysR family transcriptional regulator [Rhodocyclaceae bacterium]MDQ8001891.1 LysR family transcriptional regulator [Pseudomonadota bacterium]MDQ8016230.1 LysR family transcriptional regulator [Pseudomonadota bacterium]
MHFDLNDLRLFVAVAELGSLTRAAERQHLSLAAASARIKGLEQQSGLALLAREARGVRLLPPGEAFVHHARLMLQQSGRLHAELAEYGGGLRGHLRVFANTTAVSDFLPELLPHFMARHPRINIDLQEKPNAQIPLGVQGGRADIGIVAGRIDTLGLESIHFRTDRLVLVTSRRHRFARRRQIAFADTLDEDAVGMQEGSTLQAFLEQITASLGRSQKLRIQLGSFDAMCRMIGAGVGIGVVPESVARRNESGMQLALIELTDPWRVRERYLLVRDRAALPSYARALVAAICEGMPPTPA